MELFWSADQALSSQDVLELSPKNKKWKDNSIFIMIQTLQRKKAILETGAVKGVKGKYLRAFKASFSRPEYLAQNIPQKINAEDVPMMVSALIKNADLNPKLLDELEEMLRKKRMGED